MEFELARLRNVTSPKDFVNQLRQICNIILTGEEYLLQFTKRFDEDQIERIYEFHALPENWEQMEYEHLLEERRELMAKVIQRGHTTLTTDKELFDKSKMCILNNLLELCESNTVEFKSILLINLYTGETDTRVDLSVLKTMAGFFNTDGGTLIIGVTDDEVSLGIEMDRFKNEDAMNFHLVNIIGSRMNLSTLVNINMHFEDFEGNRALDVQFKPALNPIFCSR